MVMEDPIPDQSTLLYLFGEMVPAQRPLRPIRTERKKVLMQDMTGQDLKILLTVVRAYDVPVRADSDPINHPQRGHGDKKQGTVVGHKLYQARQIFFFNFSILLWLSHKR